MQRFAVPMSISLILLAACGSEDPPKSPDSSGPSNSSSSTGTASALKFPEDERTYYFGVNPAQTKVAFSAETDIMNIFGTSSTVRGDVKVDFKGGKASCNLQIPVNWLDTGDVARDNVMRQPAYLDGKNHKVIEFVSEKAERKSARTWEVSGKATLRGQSKDLTVKVDAIPVPEKRGKTWGEGEWIRIRTEFKLDMRDYGMELMQQYVGSVDPVWNISLILAGSTAGPAEPVNLDGPGDIPFKIMRLMRPANEKRDGLPGRVYELGRPKQATKLTATSDMSIETIVATSSLIKGYVGVDKEKGVGAVRLNLSIYSLNTAIAKRDEVLRGPLWLDGENHRFIRFESTEARVKEGNTWEVKGNFTLKGVSRPMTVAVEMEEVAPEIAERLKWGSKPVVKFRTEFNIKLSEFGVKIPEKAILKVNDEWKIQVSAGGTLRD